MLDILQPINLKLKLILVIQLKLNILHKTRNYIFILVWGGGLTKNNNKKYDKGSKKNIIEKMFCSITISGL